MLVDGVKVTFLSYPFPTFEPFVSLDGVFALAILEIAATKAYTIGRRGSFKDYVDLYFVLTGQYATLGEVIDLAERKYRRISTHGCSWNSSSSSMIWRIPMLSGSSLFRVGSGCQSARCSRNGPWNSRRPQLVTDGISPRPKPPAAGSVGQPFQGSGHHRLSRTNVEASRCTILASRSCPISLPGADKIHPLGTARSLLSFWGQPVDRDYIRTFFEVLVDGYAHT